MGAENTYQHWRLETDADHILWLTLDRKGVAVNSLSREVFDEFGRIIEAIPAGPAIAGIVILSGKKSGFIAGADVEQFTQLKDEKEALALIRQAQGLLDQFEALRLPTVAMIQGFCLGGGLELALACHYRVAENGPKTKLGLPEVKLGIHPGWGGTVRLPRLIGALQAMGIILNGSAVSARAAAKMGFVDAAVPERQLRRAASYFVLSKPRPHTPTWKQAMANHRTLRPWIAGLLVKRVRAKVREDQYPAPYAVIKNWRVHGVSDERAMEAEAKSIAALLVGDTSRNLVRAFFLQNRMKALGKGIQFKAGHVHVVGAGVMGGDIAAWCALQGLTVTLQDTAPQRIAPAIRRAYDLFQKRLKEPRLVQAAMDRLMPDVEATGVGKADVLIEAIFENLEAKQTLYRQVEPRMKPSALLATNTSSIPLDELNQALRQPERLVGVHFFNPVAMMQLVEVVSGDKTAAEVAGRAVAFVRQIDRLPLPVKSRPGFLVNRVLMPYLLEAVVLMQEGVSASVIDEAAVAFGMPMGPVTLADAVGLDVCLHVAEILTQHFGGEVPSQLRATVGAGHLGRKSGEGFYRYKKGEPVREKAELKAVTQAELADRLVLLMLNESVKCLREAVVGDADLLDAGMIYGTGFAPFRGGPLQYARARGVEAVRGALEALRARHGDRFKPDEGWSALS